MPNFSEKVSFIWSVADLLRGPYRPNQYGKVILPMTVLRRLDCVLEQTKQKVLEKVPTLKAQPAEAIEKILNRVAGQSFHNTSKLDFQKLKGDSDQIAANLAQYIKGFSSNARRIFEFFDFQTEIAKMEEANILYLVTRKFAEIDLHPNIVPNQEMGLIFEELILRFNEASNETAGDHFTPREVIRLMVNLLFEPDRDVLRKPGTVRTLFDPACGTGGMLSTSEEYLRELNPDAHLKVFGQDYNKESFAICCSDMMITGHDPENIKFGDTFTEDGLPAMEFDYMLANPPFGVEWKKQKEQIEKEHHERGFNGRFGPGLPRINEGSLLFLLHMISKMKREGSRIAIVLNASSLAGGEPESGESEIRRWVLENDWLEAIIALPWEMFYNTEIGTYVWILSNRKTRERRGKIQLINAVDLFVKRRQSLGKKRVELSDNNIAEIVSLYGDLVQCGRSKIFNSADFGYRQITIERPLRLAFQVTDTRISAFAEEPIFKKLATSRRIGKEGQREIANGREIQNTILATLRGLDTSVVDKARSRFEQRLAESASHIGVKLSEPLRKAILRHMSTRDDNAEVYTDERGNPQPDSALRSYDNVPLNEDVNAFFEREIKPYANDAWVDQTKTKIGFEIPFVQYFFKYVRPRELQQIEHDIQLLKTQLVQLVSEATA
jgi:type I restriction enzyme M protein